MGDAARAQASLMGKCRVRFRVLGSRSSQFKLILTGAAPQVVRWSHWLLGHAAAWQRDDMRLRDLLPRVATLPLGSGAAEQAL